MAHIRRLPSGSFNAQVRLPNGERVSITDPLKRVVVEKARQLESQIAHGQIVGARDRRMTVAKWHAAWSAARTVEPNTAKKDASRWRHVEHKWATWPLDSIGRLDIQTWIKEMTDAGVGAHAVQGAYQLLATMLNDAVDEKLLAASPCRKITLPTGGKPEPRWLTRHEYDRLQLALGARALYRTKARDPHAPVWQALVGLGAFSGLRPEELCGLDVEHLDFDRRLARVAQVWVEGELRPYGKSDRSRRSVPFPDEVADLLWRIVADRPSGPVFTSPRVGGRVEFANFRNRVWHPALRSAGIPAVRPYVLRHTCASWLVQAGVPDRRIMQILGHADGHLIEVYAHLRPDEHDEVRAAWAKARDAHMPHDPFPGAVAGRENAWSDDRSAGDRAF